MADPFGLFDRVRAETQPLTKEIGGETFTFPGAAPADIALEFIETLMNTPDADLHMISLLMFSKMMGDEEVERLCRVTSFLELQTLVNGLFVHYGLLSKDSSDPPNPKARRASSKRSSSGSARSARGSAASTESASRKTSKTSVGKSS